MPATHAPINVVKGNGAVHRAPWSGQYWASAPVFDRTACGVEITANGLWSETDRKVTCRRCDPSLPSVRHLKLRAALSSRDAGS